MQCSRFNGLPGLSTFIEHHGLRSQHMKKPLKRFFLQSAIARTGLKTGVNESPVTAEALREINS